MKRILILLMILSIIGYAKLPENPLSFVSLNTDWSYAECNYDMGFGAWISGIHLSVPVVQDKWFNKRFDFFVAGGFKTLVHYWGVEGMTLGRGNFKPFYITYDFNVGARWWNFVLTFGHYCAHNVDHLDVVYQDSVIAGFYLFKLPALWEW